MKTILLLSALTLAASHTHTPHAQNLGAHAVQETLDVAGKETQEVLDAKWGTDWGFSGISTFAHLPHTRCLQAPDEAFDIAILGVPFDTAVSYRPGARFGPRVSRQSERCIDELWF